MSEQQQNGQRSNNDRNQNRNSNNNRNRNNNNRNRNNNRKPRQNKPKPLVLSAWQKILIFCKITTEDKIRKQLQANRPARSQSKTTATASTPARKPNNSKPRTNTRVAKEQKAPQKVDVETPRLYVGNLSYDATEYDIEDLFKGIGSVKKVEIIYNRHTHKSKGYGFVQMLNVDEAKRAVDVLHDQPFLGRNLIVNGSKPRKESDPNSSNYVEDAESSEDPAA